MTYLEYIQQNAERIKAYHQEPFTIEELYQGRINALRAIDNAFFQYRIDDLSGIPLTREFVKESFKRSSYTGYVATMLWGGLGLSNWGHLVKAMTIDKPEVECKINNLQILLERDHIQEAFMSLQISRDKQYPQTNKFAGVDISFFTKLLYFLYDGESSVPPLIFDKWGTFIHAGILISQNETDRLNAFYKMGYDKSGRFYISIKLNQLTGYRYTVYADYLQRMSALFSENHLLHPDKLEEFLFGKDLRNTENKNNNNPRYFVSNFVKNYYDRLSTK